MSSGTVDKAKGRVKEAAGALTDDKVDSRDNPGKLTEHPISDVGPGPSPPFPRLARMLGADHPMEAHKVDSKAIFERGRSADAIEGVTAFLQKRAAAFPMKASTDMPAFYPWWPPRPFK